MANTLVARNPNTNHVRLVPDQNARYAGAVSCGVHVVHCFDYDWQWAINCSITGGVGGAERLLVAVHLNCKTGDMLRRCHVEGEEHPHPSRALDSGARNVMKSASETLGTSVPKALGIATATHVPCVDELSSIAGSKPDTESSPPSSLHLGCAARRSTTWRGRDNESSLGCKKAPVLDNCTERGTRQCMGHPKPQRRVIRSECLLAGYQYYGLGIHRWRSFMCVSPKYRAKSVDLVSDRPVWNALYH